MGKCGMKVERGDGDAEERAWQRDMSLGSLEERFDKALLARERKKELEERHRMIVRGKEWHGFFEDDEEEEEGEDEEMESLTEDEDGHVLASREWEERLKNYVPSEESEEEEAEMSGDEDVVEIVVPKKRDEKKEREKARRALKRKRGSVVSSESEEEEEDDVKVFRVDRRGFVVEDKPKRRLSKNKESEDVDVDDLIGDALDGLDADEKKEEDESVKESVKETVKESGRSKVLKMLGVQKKQEEKPVEVKKEEMDEKPASVKKVEKQSNKTSPKKTSSPPRKKARVEFTETAMEPQRTFTLTLPPQWTLYATEDANPSEVTPLCDLLPALGVDSKKLRKKLRKNKATITLTIHT